MEVRPCDWCNDLTDEWTIIAYRLPGDVEGEG